MKFRANNYEVAELTWENGQLAMHGLGGLLSTFPTKPSRWGKVANGDTLESIVQQATCNKQDYTLDDPPVNTFSINGRVTSSHKKRPASYGQVKELPAVAFTRKRAHSDSEQWDNRDVCGSTHVNHEDIVDGSACASASDVSATFCKNSDATMMTWANSLESTRSLKTKTTDEDYSSCHGGSV